MTEARINELGTRGVLWLAALALWLAVAAAPSAAGAAPPPEAKSSAGRASAEVQVLEEKHLRAQIQSLQDQNDLPWWERPGAIGLIGAALAAGGLFWTVTQQRREMARQRNADRNAALQDRQVRLDGLFAKLAADLASQDVAVRLSAFAGIDSFTGSERREYHPQLLSLLQGMIKLSRDDITDRTISRAFIRLLGVQQRCGASPARPLDLELACLSGCSLRNLDLCEADLRKARLWDVSVDGTVDLRRADCRQMVAKRLSGHGALLEAARLAEADLQEAELRKARLSGANLRGAILVSADLRDSDLRDARLQGAKLQSAHLERADLAGSRFDEADLRDAYFEGARFDQPALESILRAHGWEQARWDEEQVARLRACT